MLIVEFTVLWIPRLEMKPPGSATLVAGGRHARAPGVTRHLKDLFAVLSAIICLLLGYQPPLAGCTAFCARAGDHVLVGNNEDSDNPRTRLWFVPADGIRYGRMYVGYDDLFPQGGMNDQGLWFDGFVTPQVEDDRSPQRPAFSGNLLDEAMATCATVDEVVALFERYDRDFLESAVVMFADAFGEDGEEDVPLPVREVVPGHHVRPRRRTPEGPADPRDPSALHR